MGDAPPGRGRSARDIATRLAWDLRDGWYVNLGIGLPTLVADRLPGDREIVLHSENGLLGLGPAPPPGSEDADLTNAGKQPVTTLPGAAFFHHADSFAMVRGGHLDLSVIGAYEVSVTGDVANWTQGGSSAPAVGGAMDLVAGTPRVWVLMTHTTREGEPKLIEQCRLPLTGSGVVHRVYTDLATFEIAPDHGAFIVVDVAADVDWDELQEKTGAALRDGRLRNPPG
jgi:3-oxoacid CoA-transferase B subunit